jgi:hypothetical protein
MLHKSHIALGMKAFPTAGESVKACQPANANRQTVVGCDSNRPQVVPMLNILN